MRCLIKSKEYVRKNGMKKQKSIKRNYIYNTILTMSSFIFPLITFPYVLLQNEDG